MSSKRYYWLKLNESFFEREEIKVIENMPKGKDYIIFYMKLLLKSIKTEGKLLFRDIIPYTPEMLSSITNTDIDTVRVAIDLFTKLGLMEIWDDGTLFMIETKNMIGSETEWARKKRIQRQNQDKKILSGDKEREDEDIKRLSGDSSMDNVQENEDNVQDKGTMSKDCPDKKGECPTDIEIDIELDIDKDTYIEKEKELEKESLCMYDENLKNISKLYEENIGVITSLVAEQLKDVSEEFPADLFKEALIIAVNRKKRYINYVIGILNNWKDNNILTIDDLEALRREKEIEKQQKQQNKQYNQPKKTKFHNFEQRTDKYSEDALESIVERKREEHLRKLREKKREE
ncbi:MAG: phage replisome organizer N-terminal domain-containing protein [Thermotaleaceae bacterium]